MPLWPVKTFAAKESNIRVPDEPVELTCGCGAAVSGVRRSHFQALQCDACGDALFVLPADVYPASSAVGKPLRKKRKRRRDEETDHEAPVAETLTDVEVAPERRHAGSRPTPRRDEKEADSQAARESVRRKRRERLRRIFTPFRLVAVAIVVVVALTAWWGVERRRTEAAEEAYRTATERGLKAFQAGEFLTAADQLNQADEAGRLLEREDSQTSLIRQRLREATAASHLAGAPLFEIAAELSAADDRETQIETAVRRHRGRWIVFETTLETVTDADGVTTTRIDYPFPVGDARIRIEVDLDELPQSPASDESERIVFAAQIDSFRFEPGDPEAWVVALNSEHMFLWTDYDSLASLGLTPDDLHSEMEMRSLLKRQSQLTGMEVSP